MTLLLDLPVELLENIADQLYLDDEFPFFDQSAIPTLAALNRTCKLLRELTTRLLYRCPTHRDTWSLTRTLITCPDLAGLVTILNLEEGYVGPYDVPLEVGDHYEKAIKEGDAAAKALEGEDVLLADPEPLDRNSYVPNDVISGPCSNLEYLSCNDVISDTPYFWAPDSMKKLRAIRFAHWDTEYGFDLAAVEPLLRAAPNLEEIEFHSCTSARELDFQLHHAKTLELENSCIDADELLALLKMCPNLERFTYESGGPCVSYEDDFGVREAKELVLAHAPKLKTLVLDMQQTVVAISSDDVKDASDELSQRGIYFQVFLPVP
ncbi:hypothetical protein OQA88_8759 [Cercophora sp. LCS_1]